jgi:hypothetical protein
MIALPSVSYPMGYWGLSPWKHRIQGMKLSTHLHLVPVLKNMWNFNCIPSQHGTQAHESNRKVVHDDLVIYLFLVYLITLSVVETVSSYMMINESERAWKEVAVA